MNALTDFLLRPTALLLAAAFLSVMLRRRSASARHAIWMVALAAALVVPLMPSFLPPLTLPWSREQSADPGPAFRSSRPMLGPTATHAAQADAAPEVPETATVSLDTPRGIVVLIWLSGAVIVCARSVLGLRSARRLACRADDHGQPSWDALLNDLKQTMRIPIDVRLRIIADDDVPPLTCDVLRPIVLLPAVARQWSTETLRVTLAHELAHVKRRDVLQHLLAQACCAMHWYNPLAWYAAKRVRLERERACDDAVLALGTSAGDYAAHLLALARGARRHAAGMVSIAALSDLDARLRAILDPRLPRAPLSRGRTIVLFGTALSVTMAIGSVRLDAEPPGQPDAAATRRAMAACEWGRSGDLTRMTALVSVLGDDTPTAPVRCLAEDGWQPALWSLKHPSPGEQAAIALASFSQPAFAPLLGALGSGDAIVRQNAAWAIGELRFARGIHVDRDPAIDPLIRALSDSNGWVRTAAAFSLGELKARPAIDSLIILLGDADAGARLMAARALGEMKARRAVDALRRALTDADARVRNSVRRALAEIG